MFDGSRIAKLHRAIVLAAALALHLLAVSPVAASVIYCIGEDGHGGVETLTAGQLGCSACCHEEQAGATPEASGHANGPDECTDVSLSSDDTVRDHADTDGATRVDFVTTLPAPAVPAATRRGRAGFHPATPRGAPEATRRGTVLLL